MTKTKMKGAVVLLLALVLALALSLSAMNFAPKSTASALDVTANAESLDCTTLNSSYVGTKLVETLIPGTNYIWVRANSGGECKMSSKTYGSFSGYTINIKISLLKFKVSNCESITVEYGLNSTSSPGYLCYLGASNVEYTTDTQLKDVSASVLTLDAANTSSLNTKTYSTVADGYYTVLAGNNNMFVKSITIVYKAAPAAKTATLDVNGGEVVDTTLTADANNEVTFPSATAPTGYSFIGWTDGKNAYKAGDKVEIVGGEIFTALYASKSYSIGGNADLSAIRFVYNVEFNAATTDQMLSLLPEFVGTFNLSAEGGKEGGYNGTIDSVKISENTIMFAIQLVDIGADNKNTDVTATVSLSINGVVLLNEFAQTTSYTIATTPVE